MPPGFDIALTGDEAQPQLRIAVRPAPPGASRLRLQTRDRTRSLDLPLATDGNGIHAVLPAAALLDECPLRWDVRIGRGEGDFEPLRGQAPAAAERHFFRAALDRHGLSAYLSDSAASLVLFAAPRERHARTVETENARAAFDDYLRELPLREDLVLFESFLGKQYAGNPRYIYEALRGLRPDLRCVWAYDGDREIPGSPQRVARGSAEYYRLLAQAKYRVNNVLFAAHGRKPETVYLQTWHGTPLKRLGHDIEVAGPEIDARDNFHRESRAWTLLLSANGHSSETFRRAFRYDGEVLEAGYPLTDPLLAPHPCREEIAARLGLPSGRRFVLYAPTWRDHKAVGAWRFDFDLHLDLETVSAALAPDQILLIKAHHLVSAGLDAARLPDNVMDVSRMEDISELCVLADVLVTDYSSVFFDYATTGRPILFYCYDLDLYAERVRGLYLDVERDLPGPVARSTAELASLLNDLPAVEARYAERYAAFRARFCAWNDGDAARRVVEAVFGKAA
jgi:CDP-glycerol glycerophosphotransferase